MSETTTAEDRSAVLLGFKEGDLIQEFGYDDDVDETLRQAVEAETGTALVDEDYEDVADSAIVWWRDDDGDVDDLTDLLVDAQANLDGAGLIWVLTPKARTTGAVPAAEVEEKDGRFFFDGAEVNREYGKMGKSLKNAVAPADVVGEYGADTLRVYEMSMGPLDLSRPWETRAVVGSQRFLQRLWRVVVDEATGEVRVTDGEAGAPRIEMTAMVAALDGSRVLRRTSSVQLDPVPADVAGDPAAADEWLEDTLFVAAEALGVHVAEQFVAEGADLLPGTVRGVDRGDGAPRPDDPA